MSAVEVPLTRGYVALIDEADAEEVLSYKWSASTRRYTSYAFSAKLDTRMHRFLLGLSKGDPGVVDHINHDGLDNRRSNLRAVTRSTNSLNRRGAQANSQSGVLGIRINSGRGKPFVALVGLGGAVPKHVGLFSTAAEAAEARNAYILRLGLPNGLSDMADALALDMRSARVMGRESTVRPLDHSDTATCDAALTLFSGATVLCDLVDDHDGHHHDRDADVRWGRRWAA